MDAAAGTLRSSLAPQQPPGWLRLGFVTIVGALLARVAVLLVAWATTLLRFLPDGALTADARWWPWRVTDAWALTADVGVTLLVAIPAAWLVRSQLRSRDARWQPRMWPIVLAFAIAAPFRSPVAALMLVPVATRFVALRPSSASPPTGRPRAVVAVALALGMLALLIPTFAYQPFHPLRAGFPDRDDPLRPFELGPRKGWRTLAFGVSNEGPETVTLRSARVIGHNAALAIVRANQPIPGAVMTRDEQIVGTIALPHTVCDHPRTRSPHVTVTALELRVDALGGTRTQRFDVGPSETLRCR
jgi:hypothetical protein